MTYDYELTLIAVECGQDAIGNSVENAIIMGVTSTILTTTPYKKSTFRKPSPRIGT